MVSDIVDAAKRINEGIQGVYFPRWDGRVGVRSGEESSAPYYIRITAHDRPGVLSKVSGVLAQYNISISAVLQKGRQENGYVPIVMVTHEAVEKDLKNAKAEIDALPSSKERAFTYGSKKEILSRMKYVVIIGDGMADFPIDRAGRKNTPQVAQKPYMDMMARERFLRQGLDRAGRIFSGQRRGLHVYIRVRPCKVLYGEGAYRGLWHGHRHGRERCGLQVQSRTPGGRSPAAYDYGGLQRWPHNHGRSKDPHWLPSTGTWEAINRLFPRCELPPHHALEGRSLEDGDDSPPRYNGQGDRPICRRGQERRGLSALMNRSRAILGEHPVNVKRREAGKARSEQHLALGTGKSAQTSPCFSKSTVSRAQRLPPWTW